MFEKLKQLHRKQAFVREGFLFVGGMLLILVLKRLSE